MANDWYTFSVALFSAMGTLLFGFDKGIVTTTIAHASWVEYMGHPSTILTGAVVSIYIGGETIGSFIQIAVGDRVGRVRFMQLMCILVTVGGTVQTASVNLPMFLAGRPTLELTFLLDRWGRRPMLLTGLAGVALIEIYAAVMQREFQHTDNRVGKDFAILGIYFFVIAYYSMINSTTWLYGAEILPTAIRSKVMGVACASHFIVNIGITQAGPKAFATIHENYYYVFVACVACFWFVVYFFFIETRRKTLEEIAQAFGDKTGIAQVTTSNDGGLDLLEEKAAALKVEHQPDS